MVAYLRRHHIGLLALFIALGRHVLRRGQAAAQQRRHAADQVGRRHRGQARAGRARQAGADGAGLAGRRGAQGRRATPAPRAQGPEGRHGRRRGPGRRAIPARRAAGPKGDGPARAAGAKGDTGATGRRAKGDTGAPAQGDKGAGRGAGSRARTARTGARSAGHSRADLGGIGGTEHHITPAAGTAIPATTSVTLTQPGKVLVLIMGTFSVRCTSADDCDRTIGAQRRRHAGPGRLRDDQRRCGRQHRADDQQRRHPDQRPGRDAHGVAHEPDHRAVATAAATRATRGSWRRARCGRARAS